MLASEGGRDCDSGHALPDFIPGKQMREGGYCDYYRCQVTGRHRPLLPAVTAQWRRPPRDESKKGRRR
ncbi:Uncharacterized protein HZ326_7989 [Fusarium oxysporum f. sp. albedinis]|nr:Uncharacterized protein HZ326_7989 [Fusarium oxysporum f. sp. albedinis]